MHYSLSIILIIIIVSILGVGLWWKIRFVRAQGARFRLIDMVRRDEESRDVQSRAGTPFPQSPRLPRQSIGTATILESTIAEENPLGA